MHTDLGAHSLSLGYESLLLLVKERVTPSQGIDALSLDGSGESRELFLHLLVLSCLHLKISPCAKVADFGGAYSDRLQGVARCLPSAPDIPNCLPLGAQALAFHCHLRNYALKIIFR